MSPAAGKKPPTAPPLPTSSGHPAPSAQHGRRAVLALKTARATVAMERRDGLACFAQVKEERPIVRLGSGDSAPSMGAIFGVQVPGRAGHSEASEVQLRKGDRAWRGSMERKP